MPLDLFGGAVRTDDQGAVYQPTIAQATLDWIFQGWDPREGVRIDQAMYLSVYSLRVL
jgi:hypothetical protein